MAKWGKVDFRDFQKFQKRLDRLEKAETEKFLEACTKELAARLLAKVIPRTPVGEYPNSTGMVGGTLRRGWTAKTEAEAIAGSGNGSAQAFAFAQSLKITKVGNVYQIEIINPVNYAAYVEYGHRTRNHKGWVAGNFMLTISENELDKEAPAILERKLNNFLREILS